MKSKNIWMGEDGTLYAADKKTVIGKAAIINRFRPGSEPGTWIDARGNLYGSDRKTLLKTADDLVRERVRAQVAARKEEERQAWEQARAAAKELARERRIANRGAQKRINDLKLDEAFGKRASH